MLTLEKIMAGLVSEHVFLGEMDKPRQNSATLLQVVLAVKAIILLQDIPVCATISA